MLSYRHAFHAGNHADVLKHLCLFLTLRYYNQKDKPYWYIDTHAGAGLYDLNTAYAQKNGEYQQGIDRLWHAKDLCNPLADFRQHLLNTLPEKHQYCGSPYLAASLIRNSDKMRLYELHSSDYATLCHHLAAVPRKQCQIECSNGFQGLNALLPPPTRRAVVLIDPPYEDKNDYSQIINTLQAALKKFATGCYLLWYPCLSRQESQRLPEKLQKAFPNNTLDVRLWVQAAPKDGFGMFGSGLLMINPPYRLAEELQTALPTLCALLAQDQYAQYHLSNTTQ